MNFLIQDNLKRFLRRKHAKLLFKNLSVFSPRMLAFCASEESCFRFISCSHLCTPEKSLSMPTLRACSRSSRPNSCLLFSQNSANFRFLLHLFCCLNFYLFIGGIAAFNATITLSFLCKNTSTLRTELHFNLYFKSFKNLTVYFFK